MFNEWVRSTVISGVFIAFSWKNVHCIVNENINFLSFVKPSVNLLYSVQIVRCTCTSYCRIRVTIHPLSKKYYRAKVLAITMRTHMSCTKNTILITGLTQATPKTTLPRFTYLLILFDSDLKCSNKIIRYEQCLFLCLINYFLSCSTNVNLFIISQF